MLEGAHREVLFPDLERLALREGGEPRHRGGGPDEERGLVIEPGGREERAPVQPRRARRELAERPGVVAFDTSAESARPACVSAIFVSSANVRSALASASAIPAIRSVEARWRT